MWQWAGTPARIALVAAVLAVAVLAQPAAAQSHPTRLIRMTSASETGSGLDVVERIMSAPFRQAAEAVGRELDPVIARRATGRSRPPRKTGAAGVSIIA